MIAVFGDERLPMRFWVKTRVLDNGCWEWIASLSEQGYGKIWCLEVHKPVRAHRMSYQALRECDLDPKQTLDHTCHSEDLSCPGGGTCPHRRCVNPAHLEVVTQKENTLRGRTVAASNALKTSCPSGHEYVDENTSRDRVGRRRCRECHRINERELRAARAKARYLARHGLPANQAEAS